MNSRSSTTSATSAKSEANGDLATPSKSKRKADEIAPDAPNPFETIIQSAAKSTRKESLKNLNLEKNVESSSCSQTYSLFATDIEKVPGSSEGLVQKLQQLEEENRILRESLYSNRLSLSTPSHSPIPGQEAYRAEYKASSSQLPVRLTSKESCR